MYIQRRNVFSDEDIASYNRDMEEQKVRSTESKAIEFRTSGFRFSIFDLKKILFPLYHWLLMPQTKIKPLNKAENLSPLQCMFTVPSNFPQRLCFSVGLYPATIQAHAISSPTAPAFKKSNAVNEAAVVRRHVSSRL